MDHFAFLVRDMDRAIAFYRDVLGLELTSRQLDEELGEEFAFVKLDNCNLELLRKIPEPPGTGAAPSESTGFCPHLALESPDVDAMLDDLRERGVKVLKGPMEIPSLVKWAYFADPDDNILEIVQWYGSD
ncbi:MAG: VOC family protein [Promethearchaeota archaeon]